MTDIFEAHSRTLHREVWDLLPWMVNGSLSESQTRRVESHIAECTECCAEYEAQQVLKESIRSTESLLQTPHAPLRTLMARIEQDESRPAGVAPAPESRRMRWLAAAVVVQTVGIVTLAGIMSWKLREVRESPRYTTLSAVSAPLTGQPAARVVFAPSLSVNDVANLLRSLDAHIIAGPSEAGVYTLAFADAQNRSSTFAAVARLRSHPGVLFAELAAGAPQ